MIGCLLLFVGAGCEPFSLERKNFADCKSPSASIDLSVNRLQVNATLVNPSESFRVVEWDFGDGRSLPQTGTRAAYLYERPGTYTVRAKLTSTCSLTAAPSRTVTVAN